MDYKTSVHLTINDANAKATTSGILTAGAVGIEVDAEVIGERWAGIRPRLIAISGNVCKDMLIVGGKTTIPHECLIAGQVLYLGADGWAEDGSIRIPTIKASCGIVSHSTAEDDAGQPAPPTPDIYTQIMAAIESGRLNGKDGISPTVEVSPIDGGYRIVVTDKDNVKSFDLHDGADGDDYILTDADKAEIARLVMPYDDTEIKREQKKLKEDLTQKLTEPENMAVGKFFRIAAIDKNGHAVLEAVDAPAPDLTDYVKNTDYPTGYGGKPGVINTWPDYGLSTYNNGVYSSRLQISKASNDAISKRNTSYRPIVPDNLVYAVNSVLCSTAANEQLTAEQQLASRKRFGLDGDYELIAEIDVDTTVDLHVFSDIRLKRAALVLYATSQPSSAINMSIIFKCASRDIARGFVTSTPSLDTRRVVVEAFDNHGFWDTFTRYGLSYYNSTQSRFAQFTPNTSACLFNSKVSDYPFIDGITINSMSLMPEGSKLYLWGVE